MEKNYIGIDPGISGAVSIIKLDTIKQQITSLEFLKFKDIEHNLEAFTKKLKEFDFLSVTIEAVHSMPSDSKVSAFTFGKNVGWWYGYLTQFDVTFFNVVDPKTWHSVVLDFMFTPYKRDDNKKRTVAFVNRVMKNYLSQPLEIKSYNYDIADSICLALYGIWKSN